MNSQPTEKEDPANPISFVTGREMLWPPNMCTGVCLGGREQKGVFTKGGAQINTEL